MSQNDNHAKNIVMETIKLKTTALMTVLSVTGTLAFIGSYFFNMTMDHAEQYLSLICVVLLDGFFGIIAGCKREGFQTRKALKVLATLVVWVMFMTVLLAVEHGFKGTDWLSETILVPFIVFQILSALKNASMAGFIKADLLNSILDKIDKHKGDRDTQV
jgi:phage-related holin